MKKISSTILLSLFILITTINAHDQFSNLKFHGTEDTLTKITEIISNKQKGAYFRFGDGDINLALGINDLLQPARDQLLVEMREAFLINEPTVLKTLPLYCREFNGYEAGMCPGNHEAPYEWCLDKLLKVDPLWGGPITDVYSHAALSFAATHKQDLCINFLKFLKDTSCYMLIGNENLPQEIRDLLFGKGCIFVPTPPSQSYNDIDRIERECLNHIGDTDNYKVIITAMGCSGRPLQKRLWQKLDHVFLFDFGSLLDAICGWNSRAWIDITHFDQKAFIENLKRDVHVVCTTALIEIDYEKRKQEYVHTLKNLEQLGYIPYIFEAIKPNGPTFLDDYSNHVLYANVNDPNLKNKGVNEVRLLMEGFKHVPFADQDIVIKITGRYYLKSDLFLKTVAKHPTVDVFVKKDPYGQVYTGCYALRYNLFKELLSQLDCERMERENINFERIVANYVERLKEENKARVLELDHLDIIYNVFGKGIREVKEL